MHCSRNMSDDARTSPHLVNVKRGQCAWSTCLPELENAQPKVDRKDGTSGCLCCTAQTAVRQHLISSQSVLKGDSPASVAATRCNKSAQDSFDPINDGF
jgi:hypothetical protein